MNETTYPECPLTIDPCTYSEDGKVLIRMNRKYFVNHIDIPDGVEEIANNAFSLCHISSIHVPASVKHIGDYAFSNSTIDTITFDEGVETIGMDAFLQCLSLERVVLPNSLKKIGTNCFQESGIKYLAFPESIKAIPDYCCHKCSRLEEVRFPQHSRYIGRHAFALCTALELVVLPNPKMIDYNAFNQCHSLKQVVIHNTDAHTTIGNFVFSKCENLKTITLSAPLRRQSRTAFERDAKVAIHIERASLLAGVKKWWNKLTVRASKAACY